MVNIIVDYQNQRFMQVYTFFSFFYEDDSLSIYIYKKKFLSSLKKIDRIEQFLNETVVL